MKAIKKVIDAIAVWLFTPKPTQTYTCCKDRAEDDEEQQEEQKPQSGGLAY